MYRYTIAVRNVDGGYNELPMPTLFSEMMYDFNMVFVYSWLKRHPEDIIMLETPEEVQQNG